MDITYLSLEAAELYGKLFQEQLPLDMEKYDPAFPNNLYSFSPGSAWGKRITNRNDLLACEINDTPVYQVNGPAWWNEPGVQTGDCSYVYCDGCGKAFDQRPGIILKSDSQEFFHIRVGGYSDDFGALAFHNVECLRFLFDGFTKKGDTPE